MKWIAVVGSMLVTLVAEAQVQITSFGQNGQLSWSAPSNSVCTVEWVPSVSPGTNWQDHWAYLDGLVQTSGTRTVEVPMFYRVVCWTNGWLQPLPVGRVTLFDVSNRLSQSWNMSMHVNVILTPSRWRDVSYVEYGSTPPWEGSVAETQGSMQSTGDECVFLTEGERFGVPIWRTGTPGYSWTNVLTVSGDRTNICTIEAVEEVTVPAGAFKCFRIHVVQSPATNPIPEWYDWVSQGYGLVKRSNYNISNTNAAPVVYQLRSWQDR